MAIPTIATVDTAKALINAGENNTIDSIREGLSRIGDDCKHMCEFMENNLRPAGKWTAWCDANMTAAEKQRLVDVYLKFKAIRDEAA